MKERPIKLSDFILRAVRSVVGPGPVQLHAPFIGWRERQYVSDALATGYVSDGPYIKRFEEKLCEITGRKYAVAVSSGTAALHLAMKAIRIGPETVVECPSLTFVATANAIRYCGGVPWFTDYAQDSLPPPSGESKKISGEGGRDLPVPPISLRSAVKETRKIVAVQLLGRVQTGNVDVEDACQALGASVPAEYPTGTGEFEGRRMAGTFGKLSCFSFNGNKICTTGGGGAVVTDDPGHAAYIRHFATQAKAIEDDRGHDAIGFNYRMPNLNAALGLAQLERLPEFLERKQILKDKYARALGEQGIPLLPSGNNWLVSIRIDGEHRDPVLKALNDAGHESRALHTPLHLLPIYAGFPREDMGKTMEMWETTMCLPSGAGIA